jgi:hypothetical protein
MLFVLQPNAYLDRNIGLAKKKPQKFFNVVIL